MFRIGFLYSLEDFATLLLLTLWKILTRVSLKLFRWLSLKKRSIGHYSFNFGKSNSWRIEFFDWWKCKRVRSENGDKEEERSWGNVPSDAQSCSWHSEEDDCFWSEEKSDYIVDSGEWAVQGHSWQEPGVWVWGIADVVLGRRGVVVKIDSV